MLKQQQQPRYLPRMMIQLIMTISMIGTVNAVIAKEIRQMRFLVHVLGTHYKLAG